MALREAEVAERASFGGEYKKAEDSVVTTTSRQCGKKVPL